MSDIKKLDIGETFKEAFDIGLKNILSVFVNSLLFGLTFWIPYIGMGTTIGFMVGLVSKASKGEAISFTEVLDPKYRKYIGEFYLTAGLMFMGILAGNFGALVIYYAWSQSLLLVIDKGKNPTEALTISNNCTYGNKLMLFGLYFLVGFISWIPFLGPAVLVGLQASVYKQLTANV